MRDVGYQPLPRLSPADYVLQTRALLVAAYRELNARKLFWASIVINALVVGSVAAVGLDQDGVSVFGFQLPIPGVTSESFPDGRLHKLILATVGVGLWLSWLSTILALLSTASIFPDLASGGVDTMLSKPIGRTRLFVTMFAGGMLFTAVQVVVWAVLAFFILGLRGGSWELGIFVVVPIVLAFFSYLFCIQAVVGMISRSPIASVIVTLLFWIFVFLVDTGERFTMVGRIAGRLEIEAIEARMAKVEDEERKSGFAKRREERLETVPNWELAHDIFFAVKTVLPKTTETAQLTRRALAITTDIPVEEEGEIDEDEQTRRGLFSSGFVSQRKLGAAIEKEYETRDPWWIVGTSLGFVGAVLGFGAWHFRRRDF